MENAQEITYTTFQSLELKGTFYPAEKELKKKDHYLLTRRWSSLWLPR